ncbi:hypothetical protein JHK85_050843 [Glycine max]|nr:hypothetical protein JHK85_050843 [Glycine max]
MSEDEFLRGKVLREQQMHSFMKLVNMISRKTQELYMIVFVARYLDLFMDFISILQDLHEGAVHCKLLSHCLVHAFSSHGRRSYDRELDTFRHYFLVGASFALTLILHEKFIVQEYLNHFVSTKRLMYERFALLFSMASAWLLAKLLTSSTAYNHKPKIVENNSESNDEDDERPECFDGKVQKKGKEKGS